MGRVQKLEAQYRRLCLFYDYGKFTTGEETGCSKYQLKAGAERPQGSCFHQVSAQWGSLQRQYTPQMKTRMEQYHIIGSGPDWKNSSMVSDALLDLFCHNFNTTAVMLFLGHRNKCWIFSPSLSPASLLNRLYYGSTQLAPRFALKLQSLQIGGVCIMLH